MTRFTKINYENVVQSLKSICNSNHQIIVNEKHKNKTIILYHCHLNISA